MKNVLIFMLCLLIFQITSLTAQVRIGGLTEPNKATVLDLNASDATNDGSRGLALPRVSINDSVPLLNGVTPPKGTMIYNTNTSSSAGEGVYVMTGDANAGGTNKWSRTVTTPPSLKADSGQYMQYNGKDWVPATLGVWFYMPPFPLNVSASGTFTVDLWAEYNRQFNNQAPGSIIVSSDATAPIPPNPALKPLPKVYTASELRYYVTGYDNTVFSNLSVSPTGKLSYTITPAALGNVSDSTYMNIVFVVK